MLEVYVYRRRLYKKNSMVPFVDRIDMSPGFLLLMGCRLLLELNESNA